jgi:hypothetical protein
MRKLTCEFMALISPGGPVANPIRIPVEKQQHQTPSVYACELDTPDDKTFEKLSKRSTRRGPGLLAAFSSDR